MRENSFLRCFAFVFATIGCGLAVVSCGGGPGPEVVVGEGSRYENGTGGSQRLGLPDGSRILIGPGTVIVLAKGFGKDNRGLDLDGEAMFEVKPAAAAPFIVHTGNLQIEVMGTRFRVDAVRKRAGEEVDLLEGSLRVTKSYHSDTDNEPEVLSAGEMVMINREIDLMEKEKMSAEEIGKAKAKF